MYSKCSSLILIFFIIKLINNTEIIIPFTSFLSEIPRNLTPIELIKSFIKNELYTNINLGTPSQNLDIIIDFKNYHSYIIKDKKNDNKKYKRFYNESSSTFNVLGKGEYFSSSDFSIAVNASDIFIIDEKISNFKFTFLQILESNSDTKIQYPGILGFGLVPNSQPFHFEAGLIRQLKEKNITNNYMYTLVFNKNNDFKGKIIIEKNIYEEYSLDYFLSEYCLCSMDYVFSWGWSFIKSEYNNEKIDIVNIYLKPQIGIVLAHPSIKDLLNKKFFEEKIKEGKCYEGYYYYTFFFCEPNVKIDIGEFNFKNKKGNFHFSLNTEDLLYKYNNKIYFLMGFGINIKKNEMHLGYPFFRKYDVIFNQDKRTVGFYNLQIKNDKDIIENNDNNDKTPVEEKDIPNKNEKIDKKEKNVFFKKFIITILIIFFIFLILYFIFSVYRYIKRKSKGNLYEELNESKISD